MDRNLNHCGGDKMMKGYEDLVAGLLLLVVVLVGGYVYLNSQVIKQKQSLQVPAVEKKAEKRSFESLMKHTEVDE